MAQRGEKQTINLQVTSFDEGKAALEAIFEDKATVSCMEARLKNTDMPRDREKIKAKRLEALEAFFK